MMIYAINRTKALDTFRARVLAALDDAALEAFPCIPSSYRGQEGSGDAELPDLFRALDAHVAKLCAKYDIVMVDHD